MAMTIRADSTEYVTATVTADHDITGDRIDVATPVKGEEPATWTTTVVLSVIQQRDPKTGELIDKWTATYRLLMGPKGGDVALEAGTYDWILKIHDSPEVPVRKVDTITVK